MLAAVVEPTLRPGGNSRRSLTIEEADAGLSEGLMPLLRGIGADPRTMVLWTKTTGFNELIVGAECGKREAEAIISKNQECRKDA